MKFLFVDFEIQITKKRILRQRMKTHKDIMQECTLPNFLLEDWAVYTCMPKSPLAAKIWSTLIHLYKSLYDTIQSGCYNLSLSCKQFYEDDFRIDNEDDQFIRCQFLNSALMHYNSAFDVTIECIWIGFGLYRYIKNDGVLSLNSKKDTEKVLSLCTYAKIKSLEKVIDVSLFKELKKLRNKHQKIASWTNNLKHRGNLVYKEYFEETIHVTTVSKDGNEIFDSSKVQSQVTIDKVIESLISYHTSLIVFVKHLAEFYKDRILKTAQKSIDDQT